jgi:hypothetical protein
MNTLPRKSIDPFDLAMESHHRLDALVQRVTDLEHQVQELTIIIAAGNNVGAEQVERIKKAFSKPGNRQIELNVSGARRKFESTSDASGKQTIREIP